MTANYEIGYNTVTDVNFSLETAVLAKKPNIAASIYSNAGSSKCRTAGAITASAAIIAT